MDIIREFIASQKKEGLLVMTDPIMGDDGKLYNGVTEETVENMRRLLGVADVIVPNLTEAEFLTGKYQGRESLTAGEARELVDGLLTFGPRSVVVTSGVEEETGRHVVWGYNRETGAHFTIPYQFIQVHFPGTGDMFSAVLVPGHGRAGDPDPAGAGRGGEKQGHPHRKVPQRAEPVTGCGCMWAGFALLSALFAALTSILAKLGMEGINSNLAKAIRTAVVLVMAWGIVFLTGKHHGIGDIGGRSWIFLILSGVATGLSWLCYYRALQLGEASRVVPIDKFSVVISMVLAFVVLREAVTVQTVIGGLLITAGTLVLIL